MAKSFNDVDAFLDHQPGIERRGGKYMRSWKKNGKSPNGGSLAVWLHTDMTRAVMSVWMHQFPRTVVTEDKQTRVITKNYYMSDFVCWEDEELLRKMYQRNPDGTREYPPQRCPICKLLEVLYQAIAAGDISTFDEVFRFEGATDPTKNIVLHAGGMLNLWKKDRMTDGEKAEFASRGLYFNSSWKENCQAKNNYVLCLVQQDDVGAGVQIDTEPSILGDKLRGMINDAIASRGPAGNPFKNPYCIEFVYDETKSDFKDKYRARPLERFPLTEQIKQLIYAEPPSLSHVTSPFNGAGMRAVMEAHRRLDAPWDEIFSEPQPADSGAADDFQHGANAPAAAGREVAAPPHPQAEAEGLEPCTTKGCGIMLRPDEMKCPNCGTEYDDVPAPATTTAPVQQAPVYTPAVAGPPTAHVQFQPPPPQAPPPAQPMRSIGGKTRGGPQAPRKPGEPA